MTNKLTVTIGQNQLLVERIDWSVCTTAKIPELAPQEEPTKPKLKFGDKVRICDTCDTTGTVSGVDEDDETVRVHFNKNDLWWGVGSLTKIEEEQACRPDPKITTVDSISIGDRRSWMGGEARTVSGFSYANPKSSWGTLVHWEESPDYPDRLRNTLMYSVKVEDEITEHKGVKVGQVWRIQAPGFCDDEDRITGFQMVGGEMCAMHNGDYNLAPVSNLLRGRGTVSVIHTLIESDGVRVGDRYTHPGANEQIVIDAMRVYDGIVEVRFSDKDFWIPLEHAIFGRAKTPASDPMTLQTAMDRVAEIEQCAKRLKLELKVALLK